MIPAAPAALTLVRPMYFFESTTRALVASLVFGSALLATTPMRSAAQAAARSNPASFTTAQAEQGKMIFDETCSRCHSSDLSGGEGPPLLGQPLLYNWGGQRISGLIRFVQTNMPMSAPGTLDMESAVNVVAYVLSRNRVAPGDAPLTATSTGVLIVPPPGRNR